MAVRFVPPPAEGSSSRAEHPGDLAEVIELRSQLRRPRATPLTDEMRGGHPAGSQTDGWSRARSHDPSLHDDDDRLASVVSDAEDESDTETEPDAPAAGPALHLVRPVVHANFAERVTQLGGTEHTGAAVQTNVDASKLDAADQDDDAESDDAAGDEHDVPSEIESAETGRTATEDGVRLLGRRARSSGELREELARLDHGVDAIEDVIDEFTRSLYLDDLGLARTLTEKLRDTKRASRSQIRVKLQARKLPNDVIETALGELDVDQEFELLRETARQRAAKLGGLDRQVAERRLLGFLARRGWSGEPATRAARDALDGAGRASRGGSGVRFQ